MDLNLNKTGITEINEQKKLTIILPNIFFGSSWAVLEKGQDFIPESCLVELKDGYLVTLERGILIKAINSLSGDLPKRSLEFFSKCFEDSLNRLMYDLKSFEGGKISIYGTSSALISFFNDKQIPNYCVDFKSLMMICKKYGFNFKLAGRGIPVSALDSDEKVTAFLKTCSLSGSGDSVVVELVKDE